MSSTVIIEIGGIADSVRTWSHAKDVRDSQFIDMSTPAVSALLLLILLCDIALAVSLSLPAGFRYIHLFGVNDGEISKLFAISLRNLFERTLSNVTILYSTGEYWL